MNIELINTGTELMLGRVLNSHQQWLCAQLAHLGYIVDRQVAVADDGPAIQAAVREALDRADLIITTGGLGPTSDDITRDLIAELLGKKLTLDSGTLLSIKKFFAQRKRPVPPNAKRQALVPEGAVVLPNQFGTAPGLAMKVKRSSPESALKSWLIMLPGPPRELRFMFTELVVPLLRKQFPLKEQFVCRTLHTTGIGESFLEEKIQRPLHILTKSGLELGYCARVGEVDVRLVARGKKAEKIVNDAEKIIRKQIDLHIFGQEAESLEAVIVRAMTKHKQTLALAESCTGGMIAHRLTNVPGASAVLVAGLVTYANAAKIEFAGVREATLKKYGAVSAETVREMAEGARLRSQVNFAIAVSGVAGPGGGTKAKPVGTVYIALALAGETVVEKHFNPYDRETFKFITSQQALDLLRRNLRQKRRS